MPCSAFFFGDDAGDRRAEGQRALRFAGTGQRLDLFFGNVPVFQALQAGFGQLLHAGLHFATGVLE